MPTLTSEGRLVPNPFLDAIEALADRHGEIDVRLERLTVRLPLMPEAVELNGALTVSVHLRALTEKEKAARVAKEVRILQR
jgi:hypothetical protein